MSRLRTLRVLGAALLSSSVAAIVGLPSSAHAETWENPTSIEIDNGTEASYIGVAAPGVVGSVHVVLEDVSHNVPKDMDIALLGPNGQRVVLMSDSCSGVVDMQTLVIADQGESFEPGGDCSSGFYRPTDNEDVVESDQCPGATASTLAEAFAGSDPTGTWRLEVCDDRPGDSTFIAGGWSLGLSVVPPLSLCQGAEVTVDLAKGQTPTEGADVIMGTADRDLIDGLGGDDTICGSGDDDLILGGPGDDRIGGGAGRDTASYAGSANPVTVSLATTGAQATGRGLDTLQSIEDLYGGAGADKLIGKAGPNHLHGGGGADTISGRAGDDHLDGGKGGDVCNGGVGTDTAYVCETKKNIP